MAEEKQETVEYRKGEFFPPVQVALRICSVCGRTDRYTHLKLRSYHYGKDGKRCPGEIESVTYELAICPAS